MPLIDLAEILAVARDARAASGQTGPPYSTDTLIQALAPDVLVTGAELPTRILEQVLIADGKRTIFYNRKVNSPAQRVGIAHGLAHVVFDLFTGARPCGVNYQSAQMPLAPEERRADLFAGELLVPLVDLDRMLDGQPIFPRDPADRHAFDDLIDNFASRFKVPAGFLRWRAWDLMHLRRTNFCLP